MAFRQWYGTVGPLPAILAGGALVAVAGVVTGWQPVSGMLLMGPVLAGMCLGPRPTAAVTLWSVALLAAIYASRGGVPLSDTVLFCVVLLGCGGSAVRGAYRRVRAGG